MCLLAGFKVDTFKDGDYHEQNPFFCVKTDQLKSLGGGKVVAFSK